MNNPGYVWPTRVGVIVRNITVSSRATSNRKRLTSVSTRQARWLESVAAVELSSGFMLSGSRRAQLSTADALGDHQERSTDGQRDARGDQSLVDSHRCS